MKHTVYIALREQGSQLVSRQLRSDTLSVTLLESARINPLLCSNLLEPFGVVKCNKFGECKTSSEPKWRKKEKTNQNQGGSAYIDIDIKGFSVFCLP